MLKLLPLRQMFRPAEGMPDAGAVWRELRAASGNALLEKEAGKPQGKLREKDNEENLECDTAEEQPDIPENCSQGNITGHGADTEHVDAHRRRDDGHFSQQHDNNAEPDGIEAQSWYGGKDGGRVSRSRGSTFIIQPMRT